MLWLINLKNHNQIDIKGTLPFVEILQKYCKELSLQLTCGENLTQAEPNYAAADSEIIQPLKSAWFEIQPSCRQAEAHPGVAATDELREWG